MSLKRPKVFYFRSLDTAGNDEIKVGPFALGTFSSRFESEFEKADLDFVPVLGMGAGSLFKQAERAKEFLEKNEDFSLNEKNIHFFGHSAGGLVAKLVAAKEPQFQQRLCSLITVGTPHRGSQAARWAAGLTETSPRLARFYKMLRYDFAKKKGMFESFEEIAKAEFEIPKEVLTASIVCAPAKETWSWLYRWIHKFPVMKEFEQPSDGLIQKSSQVFGEIQWEFDLDHIQQIGIGGQTEEFKRMCRLLKDVWIKSQQDQNFLSREISFKASLSSEREADS